MTGKMMSVLTATVCATAALFLPQTSSAGWLDEIFTLNASPEVTLKGSALHYEGSKYLAFSAREYARGEEALQALARADRLCQFFGYYKATSSQAARHFEEDTVWRVLEPGQPKMQRVRVKAEKVETTPGLSRLYEYAVFSSVTCLKKAPKAQAQPGAQAAAVDTDAGAPKTASTAPEAPAPRSATEARGQVTFY